MPTATTSRNGAIVVSALSLRTNLGKILRRMDVERRSLVFVSGNFRRSLRRTSDPGGRSS